MANIDAKFERFKKLCTDILSQSGNCKESQADMAAANTVPELVAVWLKYWHGLITEVPQQTIAALSEVYDDYKDEINAAGVYFNESTDKGEVLVGDCPNVLKFRDKAKVYVLGKAEVCAYDHVYVYADNEDAKILLNDYSRGNIHKSTVHACDWSSVITDSNKVFCADAATVDITGGVVCDAGHREINAYKGTVVYSNLKKGITLDNTSKLLKKNS